MYTQGAVTPLYIDPLYTIQKVGPPLCALIKKVDPPLCTFCFQTVKFVVRMAPGGFVLATVVITQRRAVWLDKKAQTE